MINELLFWAFNLICFLILFEGIKDTRKIYQFPFFMSAAFASFISPQAYALVYNRDYIYNLPSSAITRTLFMCCLCVSMCWIGYQVPVKKNSTNIFFNCTSSLDNHKYITILNTAYVALGIAFWLLLFSLPDGNKLSGQSTGIFTIYIFFARLFANTGLCLAIVQTFKKPGFLRFSILLAASTMPLYRAIFFGRRTGLVGIILFFLISLYIYKSFIPPRSVIVFALTIGFILIPFIGEQRGLLSNKWNNLEEINPTHGIEKIIEGKSTLELRNAAFLIDYVAKENKHGWGTLYWNNTIFRFVPAQLLGRQFKESLYINKVDYDTYIKSDYSYSRQTGSTVTGAADSFTQFDYFGCLLYFGMAFLFKTIWHSVIYYKSFIATILYMLICVYGMVSVTHGTANFVPDLLFTLVSILPILIVVMKTEHATF